MRSLFHLLWIFTKGLSRGEAWTYWVLGAGAVAIALWAFVNFARRPLGGDPDRLPSENELLRDDKNPYRHDL